MADKTKKPIYKRIWFWVLIVLVIGAVGSGVSGNSGSNTSSEDEAAVTQETSADNSDAQEESEPEVPKEYENALIQAENYSDTLHMSKQGIYDQLVSEYGGQFSPEAAQYAIDNIDADWNANALAKLVLIKIQWQCLLMRSTINSPLNMARNSLLKRLNTQSIIYKTLHKGSLV